MEHVQLRVCREGRGGGDELERPSVSLLEGDLPGDRNNHVFPLLSGCLGWPCTQWEEPGNGSKTVNDLDLAIHHEDSVLFSFSHTDCLCQDQCV